LPAGRKPFGLPLKRPKVVPRQIPHFYSVIIEVRNGDLAGSRNSDSSAILAPARIVTCDRHWNEIANRLHVGRKYVNQRGPVRPMGDNLAGVSDANLEMEPRELDDPGLNQRVRGKNGEPGVVGVEDEDAVARARLKIKDGQVFSWPAPGSSNAREEGPSAIKDQNLTLRYGGNEQNSTVVCPSTRHRRGEASATRRIGDRSDQINLKLTATRRRVPNWNDLLSGGQVDAASQCGSHGARDESGHPTS
jgi:hypothetical protein